MLKTPCLWWAVAAASILAGCGPETVEGFTAAPSASGNPAFSVYGYTQPGERNPAFGEAYARAFADQACPEGGTVVRVDTQPSRNMFASFLRWQAIIECAGPGATPTPEDGQPAVEAPPAQDPAPATPAPSEGGTVGEPLRLPPSDDAS